MFKTGCRQVHAQINQDKTEFFIFGSHAQLNKLDPHLPIRIFGNLMHAAVVVKNLCVCLMLTSPLLIMSAIFLRHASFKCVISDEAPILAANSLVSSCLDYCNFLFRSLSSFNMYKL